MEKSQMDGLTEVAHDTLGQAAHFAGHEDQETDSFRLTLWVTDPDLVQSLTAVPEGRKRDAFALDALRIGVLAFRQAQGRIDADLVRGEGEKLLAGLSTRFQAHQEHIDSTVAATLREYFDPQSGRFSERVTRFIGRDGELEQVLQTRTVEAVNAMDAALSPYLGKDSELLRLLTPDESNVFVASIKASVDRLVTEQQTKLLAEFSLDNPVGALSRLVDEVSMQNGRLKVDLEGSVQNVVREFSLDSDDSALSRLMKRVETAQRQISAEFSLDSEQSALSRMKRDLTGLIESLKRESTEFQGNVLAALEAMKARKQESRASTAHGRDFEEAALQFVEDLCQQAGDIPIRTGNTTGAVRHCKKGDCIVRLGPDTDAQGANIVLEMKENASYTLANSLEELREARENREASAGLFVHSARTAPKGLRRLGRYGNDVVVVWDPEDSTSDVFFSAGLMVAKALALRKSSVTAELAADFAALDKAIREVERHAGGLDEIENAAKSIRGGADKILRRVDQLRSGLEQQIGILDQQNEALRALVGDATPEEGA